MASEQGQPCYILRRDDNMDCLPTFLAGLDMAWTSLYMGSLFWEKGQVTHHQVVCGMTGLPS